MPFLFQKARRLLPITVKSDSGLAEGEIWFLDGEIVTFWCKEQLRAASKYEMRADVKTLGRNVDLIVEVVEIMPGREAGVSSGYLHQGGFITLEDGDEQRLAKRFWQINPEHAPSDLATERPNRPVGSPTGPGRSPESAVPERPRRRLRRSSQGGATSGGGRKLTPGQRRRLRGEQTEAGTPQPPLDRAQRVVADVGPGDPISLMVRYEHREVMQADAVLQGDTLWLFIAPHPLLWPGQQDSLFLQLPAGHVVQTRGDVADAIRSHCLLRAPHLHASLVANIQAALGA